jgi:phosphoribosylformylglycinamidine synthase
LSTEASDSRLQTPDSRLFGETPSRIIISFDESARTEIEALAAEADCPITILGNVGGDRLRITSGGEEVVNLRVSEMEAVWRSSLKLKLQAEAMAAGAE